MTSSVPRKGFVLGPKAWVLGLLMTLLFLVILAIGGVCTLADNLPIEYRTVSVWLPKGVEEWPDIGSLSAKSIELQNFKDMAESGGFTHTFIVLSPSGGLAYFGLQGGKLFKTYAEPSPAQEPQGFLYGFSARSFGPLDLTTGTRVYSYNPRYAVSGTILLIMLVLVLILGCVLARMRSSGTIIRRT